MSNPGYRWHCLPWLAAIKVALYIEALSGEKESGVTFEKKSSYTFEELLECGHGQLFGEGNAQLPLPPF